MVSSYDDKKGVFFSPQYQFFFPAITNPNIIHCSSKIGKYSTQTLQTLFGEKKQKKENRERRENETLTVR